MAAGTCEQPRHLESMPAFPSMESDVRAREPQPTAAARRSLVLAAAVIIAFALINNVRFAFYRVPWYLQIARASQPVGVTIWKFAQVPLVVIAVMAVHRARLRVALEELGLRHNVTRSLTTALVATLPALVLVAVTTRGLAPLDAPTLIKTAAGSAVAEELLYRGFLFRQLHRRARWPFWLAALTTALPFAAGHLYQREGRGLAGFGEVMLVMGVASIFLAWVFVSWDDNTWLLIGIHGFANLWWALFVGDDTAKMYGWLTYAFMIALLLPLVWLTVRARNRGRPPDVRRDTALAR